MKPAQRVESNIQTGDFVRFRYLEDSKATPIEVVAVGANGMVYLYGRGWFQPHFLVKVEPPAKRKRSA